MGSNIFNKWILTIAFTISILTVNAQNTTNGSPPLTAQQQSMLTIAALTAVGDQKKQAEWMVRIAKIEVDTAYLSQYKAFIEEHTRAAIATEPGVLALYALFEKEHPSRVMVLEVYASREAYQAHIKMPHFLKYKNGTLNMVKSLELIDVNPIAFGAKPDFLENEKE
jgi:quinol monooxygenase YgiN